MIYSENVLLYLSSGLSSRDLDFTAKKNVVIASRM